MGGGVVTLSEIFERFSRKKPVQQDTGALSREGARERLQWGRWSDMRKGSVKGLVGAPRWS
jgi:hypothetical protein